MMWQGALVRKRKTPSVLAVSPAPCALQLYRITLFTRSPGGGLGFGGGAALGESGSVSLQNNHIKTHKSGNLTSVSGGGGRGGVGGV